jgi:hypothetical protein
MENISFCQQTAPDVILSEECRFAWDFNKTHNPDHDSRSLTWNLRFFLCAHIHCIKSMCNNKVSMLTFLVSQRCNKSIQGGGELILCIVSLCFQVRREFFFFVKTRTQIMFTYYIEGSCVFSCRTLHLL